MEVGGLGDTAQGERIAFEPDARRVDDRTTPTAFELEDLVDRPPLVGQEPVVTIDRAQHDGAEDVHREGCLVEPNGCGANRLDPSGGAPPLGRVVHHGEVDEDVLVHDCLAELIRVNRPGHRHDSAGHVGNGGR